MSSRFNESRNMPTDKVRILVLGNSGVGKTSLVKSITSGSGCKNPKWTVGCDLEVKAHPYQGSFKNLYWIEFFDVSGSQRFELSRQMFYGQAINGLILVHDTTNRKSYTNLKKWILDLIEAATTFSNLSTTPTNDTSLLAPSSSSSSILDSSLSSIDSSPSISSTPSPRTFTPGVGSSPSFSHKKSYFHKSASPSPYTTHTTEVTPDKPMIYKKQKRKSNTTEELVVEFTVGDRLFTLPLFIVGTHSDELEAYLLSQQSSNSTAGSLSDPCPSLPMTINSNPPPSSSSSSSVAKGREKLAELAETITERARAFSETGSLQTPIKRKRPPPDLPNDSDLIVSCHEDHQWIPGSSVMQSLGKFFDRVIRSKYFDSTPSPSPSPSSTYASPLPNANGSIDPSTSTSSITSAMTAAANYGNTLFNGSRYRRPISSSASITHTPSPRSNPSHVANTPPIIGNKPVTPISSTLLSDPNESPSAQLRRFLSAANSNKNKSQ